MIHWFGAHVVVMRQIGAYVVLRRYGRAWMPVAEYVRGYVEAERIALEAMRLDDESADTSVGARARRSA